MAAVQLENLTLSYNRHPAVHHISGRFESGTLTAVTGPNGAGKSTLMKAIAGIITPDSGRVHIEKSVHETVAYLPQSSEIQRDFPLSVLHLVTSGLWNKSGMFRAISNTQKDQAIHTLEQVGLSGFENRDIASLSYGQFQRVLFARLLLQDASLIILDEPFTAIDAETTEHLLDIIARMHKEKRTVICVLHDIEQIRKHFPDCLLLARECIAWGKTEHALKMESLQRTMFFRDRWTPNPEICKQAS
jgi:zinc/manganese transport system ATP-binding protein